MMKTFENFDQLAASGYLFRIADNRGETLDRYTVLFSDGDALGMSEAGVGFSQFVGEVDPAVFQELVDAGEWEDCPPESLSDETKNHIVSRVNESFADFLADLEAGKCPSNRSDVREMNDGMTGCAGKGIWKDAEGYSIAVEDNDDRGPYATAAEALRASLPEEHALSGPEYHSPSYPTP